MCDCEDDQLAEAFGDALSEFVEEWRNKNIHGGIIIPCLIIEAKIEACFYHECYTHMVGKLSHCLHEDLKLMFDDINRKDENEPDLQKEIE